MPFIRAASQVVTVGVPIVVDAPCPGAAKSAVFEDDGETGYFYAVETSGGEAHILDATMIYEVASVSDRHLPSTIDVLWNEQKTCVALLINNHPHAVFDFESKRGYCREEFPPSNGEWERHPWNERLREHFV